MSEPRLVTLAKQRDALKAHIAALQLQLADAQRALRRNEIETASFAPVYVLPDDVLKMILEEAYEHDFDGETQSCATPGRDPLPATHVCRRWRATALSLPTLWRCIHVHGSRPLLQLWATRSGLMPLKVTCQFGWKEKRLGRTRDMYRTRVQDLVELGQRWQHFHLEVDSTQSLFDITTSIDRDSLQSLSLRYLGGDDEDEFMDAHLPSFPNLKSLSIANIPPSSISLPQPSLAFLRLSWCGYMFSEALRSISQAAPSLAELTIESAGRSTDEPFDRVTFPRIRKMTFCSVFLYQEFFKLFDMPALRSLVVRDTNLVDMGYSSLYDVSEAARFLRNVTHLTMQRCKVPSRSPYHKELFRYSPSVATLSLCDTANADVILRDLAEGDAQLLPRLQALELTASHEPPDSVRNLLPMLSQFLETRRRAGGTLKTIKLGRGLEGDMRRGFSSAI
ncbi:hypothetical protein PsYK624_026040 [Phanerochaete sordida]|uniref:F-box domain-containing protein n=1 Tax=Phanerochaete sordida TaxID=48140 RepID=A0A9P3G2M2_9APHY|nr:hypothetical protein PsYK624_026040 [Phanerochaete sordida]